jgi:hypothetical protein
MALAKLCLAYRPLSRPALQTAAALRTVALSHTSSGAARNDYPLLFYFCATWHLRHRHGWQHPRLKLIAGVAAVRATLTQVGLMPPS